MTDGALLVVDDYKPNRDVLARRLSREGYEVLTAESGREALKILSEQKICLILLDLMMPEMSGSEVLAEVRKTHSDIDLPVLMVSANTDSPAMVETIDLGANDYLTKPVDFDLLLAKLRRHLGRGSGVIAHPAAAPAPVAAPKVSLNAPTGQPPKIGDLLGHYELLELVGEGGMGQVYKARDTRLLREVAVKVVVGEDLPKEALERFVLEARAVARVSHPGVVTIYEIGTEPRHFIAMELLHGLPLDEVAEQGQLEPKRVRYLMCQVLEALAVVHEAGVTHRDLKPANIMVCAHDRTKVMDFGLAKLADVDSKLTQSGQVWGTPQYMAPEQIDPDVGRIDGQTDIFAASAIIYELLTSRRPFKGHSMPILIYEILSKDPIPPHKINPNIPEALSHVVLTGLSKRKEMRYRTCLDFISALEAVKL